MHLKYTTGSQSLFNTIGTCKKLPGGYKQEFQPSSPDVTCKEYCKNSITAEICCISVTKADGNWTLYVNGDIEEPRSISNMYKSFPHGKIYYHFFDMVIFGASSDWYLY